VNLGILNRDELSDVMAQVDLVWMPSRYETFGMVAMEAIAQGIPVLASDVAGLRDIVIPGKSGYLVRGWNPADHLRAIDLIAEYKGLHERDWEVLKLTTQESYIASFSPEKYEKRLAAFASQILEVANQVS
jgi:glycosyltransferase involved in cell wall biosynthesis